MEEVVTSKFRQEWRPRFAERIRSGQYVVFVGGKRLTPEEVLTADSSMMDVYITRKGMQDTAGNPQEAPGDSVGKIEEELSK